MAEPPHINGLPSEREPLREEDSAERLAVSPQPESTAAETTGPVSSDADCELDSSDLQRISGTSAIDGERPPNAAAAAPPLPPTRAASLSGDGMVPDPRAQFGRLIADRYRIVDLLAEGGMGAVYLAEHVVLRSPVAMKLLQPEARNLPELVERFQREAVVGAHIKHPHIASATDFGSLPDGSYYLVLELVEGTTLDNVLRGGPLAPQRAARIASQVADALSALHERGVVHRDIKPGNVMLLERAGVARGTDFVKVIDFGLAKLDPNRLPVNEADDVEPDERLTNAGVVIGTVAYMAPEAGQGMHAVDERSDLYALGVLLYRALAGKHPFASRNDVDLFQKHVNEPPPSFATRAPEVAVPRPLEAIVLKLLAKNPDERYQTAAEVVEALKQWMDGAADEVATTRAPPEPGAPDDIPQQNGAAPSDASVGPSVRWSSTAVLGVSGVALTAVVVAVVVALQSGSTRSAARSTEPALSAAVDSAVPSATGLAAASAALAPSASVRPPLDPGKPDPLARSQFVQAVGDQAWMAAYRAFRKLASKDRGFFSKYHAKRDTERLFAALSHAQVPEAHEMVRLLANDLGPPGHDVLLKAVMLRGGSEAHKLATQILSRPEIAAQLAPAPAVALRLYQLDCEVAPDVYDEAVRIGDGRALTMLAVQRERRKHDETRVRAYRALEKRLLAEQAAAAK